MKLEKAPRGVFENRLMHLMNEMRKQIEFSDRFLDDEKYRGEYSLRDFHRIRRNAFAEVHDLMDEYFDDLAGVIR